MQKDNQKLLKQMTLLSKQRSLGRSDSLSMLQTGEQVDEESDNSCNCAAKCLREANAMELQRELALKLTSPMESSPQGMYLEQQM